jgi:hypothetical protein
LKESGHIIFQFDKAVFADNKAAFAFQQVLPGHVADYFQVLVKVLVKIKILQQAYDFSKVGIHFTFINNRRFPAGAGRRPRRIRQLAEITLKSMNVLKVSVTITSK